MALTSSADPSLFFTGSASKRRPAVLKKISSYNPRVDPQDVTIKNHDFAYESGQPDPSPFSQLITSIQVLASPLFSHPQLINTLTLIFTGCCSNVYTLESLLKLSPQTGLLITFLQFLLISVYALPGQLTFLTTSTEPSPLRPAQSYWLPRFKARVIPLSTWFMFASQFVLINWLNNAAFAYKISLPLHIILRSGGPVAGMLVGRLAAGKRYSRQKVIAVALLFVGVVIAAMSDSMSKSSDKTSFSSKPNSTQLDVPSNGSISAPLSPATTTTTLLKTQLPGFVLLTTAMILSATFGLWCDNIYTQYGRSSRIASEQLFYAHFLSLPFFLLQYNALRKQYLDLTSAASLFSASQPGTASTSDTSSLMSYLTSLISSGPALTLLLNCITQVVCITGVHRLSTQTNSLAVSVVLNIRKLISLLLSVALFGNQLTSGVVLGAALVFGGGGLYAWPERRKEAKQEGVKESKKEE